MKRAGIKFVALAALAFVTGLSVYEAQTNIQLSETQLKNVEALAVDKDYTSPYSCIRGGDFCNLFLNGEEVFSSTEFRAQY